MEIQLQPKGPDDWPLEWLEVLMGEEGLAFLNLDYAITAVKQVQPFWQASFAIGLAALPFLYDCQQARQGTAPNWAVLVLLLASQTYSKSKDSTMELVGSAIVPLKTLYDSLEAKRGKERLDDELAHMLFHTRFALGVLLLLEGDEVRASEILSRMVKTKTATTGPTYTSEGLKHLDVPYAKAFAAIILQDFYAKKRDYAFALYLLREAVASIGTGPLSEGLLAVVPGLLESCAKKCEGENDFMEWVDLFDRASGIIEICGEADVSGELPSDCRATSPQYLAWKFGQFVARFAIQYTLNRGDARKLLPSGYQSNQTMVDSILGEGGYGDDWGNGTVVASLLCEYNEHRNWQSLRQQYISMWESLPSYQWLSLREAGTGTDLYWAMRIGFADKILSALEQQAGIQVQTEKPDIARCTEMIKNIASTIALRQIKEQQVLEQILDSQQKIVGQLPRNKREIARQLQQILSPVWSKLPTKVVDTLVKAESYYRTGVDTDDAKVWFHKAVEASLYCCLVEPLVSFTQKRSNERIAVCFRPPRGVERMTPSKLRKLSLGEWSDILETFCVPVVKSLGGLGIEDMKQFMEEHFAGLPLPALRELSRSLGDFCQYRKEGAHYHIPRYEEEMQELEQMRELVLGTRRPSIITQIFQLFTKISLNRSGPV